MTDKLNNLYGKVKQDWSKQEILDGIDDIIDDFESSVCDNCASYNNSNGMCYFGVDIKLTPSHEYVGTPKDFGCNKFTRKQDG